MTPIRNRPPSTRSSLVPSSTKRPAPSTTHDLGALTEVPGPGRKKPARPHANSTGGGLWYGPTNGFWVGDWNLPTYGYTHWMMLPDAPEKVLTRAEQAELDFSRWLQATTPALASNDLAAGDAALRQRMHAAFMQGALS